MYILNNKPVLIVEDNCGHARLLELALRDAGIENEVKMINSGIDAEALLFSGAGDNKNGISAETELIMLDLNLPGVDGHDILKKIRTTRKTMNHVVVIVTSSVDPDEEERCKKLGADALVQKPPEKQKLLSMFRRLALV